MTYREETEQEYRDLIENQKQEIDWLKKEVCLYKKTSRRAQYILDALEKEHKRLGDIEALEKIRHLTKIKNYDTEPEDERYDKPPEYDEISEDSFVEVDEVRFNLTTGKEETFKKRVYKQKVNFNRG